MDIDIKILTDLLIVSGFSLLIGMEQKRHYLQKEKTTFGTDRTFTFIGLSGFLLALLPSPVYFIAGLLVTALFLSIFYARKLNDNGGRGMTSEVLAILVFIMPTIVVGQSRWLALLIYVLLLILAEMKGYFEEFSKKIDKDEFFTLSKFIIMAGVILPILPRENIGEYIPVSAYKIWLAVVVISGISYVSYALKNYVFPKSGLLLTGILGGLYSSTATTFIIARKSKEKVSEPGQYAGAILAATSMMYLRLFVIAFIFNEAIAITILPYFAGLTACCIAVSWWMLQATHQPETNHNTAQSVIQEKTNPLEFKIALIFSVLYIVFTSLTHIILQHFGASGLKVMSFLVGFTDIDPFLMNLFQSQHGISIVLIAIATLQATFSNNVLKAVYGTVLSETQTRKKLLLGFGIIVFANLAAISFFYMNHGFGLS